MLFRELPDGARQKQQGSELTAELPDGRSFTDCVDPDGIPRYRSLSAHLSERMRIRVVPRREQSSSLGSDDLIETKAFLFGKSR